MTNIEKAEKILVDNGIDADEAATVLQAIGYALLNKELYPETNTGKPTVTFRATWTECGSITIPIPDDVDPNNEKEVWDFVESKYPDIPLTDFDSDYVSDSDSLDVDGGFEINIDGKTRFCY